MYRHFDRGGNLSNGVFKRLETLDIRMCDFRLTRKYAFSRTIYLFFVRLNVKVKHIFIGFKGNNIIVFQRRFFTINQFLSE